MWLLFNSQVHHLQDGVIGHICFIDPFFLGVLLAVGKDIFSDLAVANF